MRCIFYMILGAGLVLGIQEHYAVTEFLKSMLSEGATWVLAMTNDPTAVVTMLVKYMSEDDVADCMDCNELSDRFMEEQ